jgi:hypothetical protein
LRLVGATIITRAVYSPIDRASSLRSNYWTQTFASIAGIAPSLIGDLSRTEDGRGAVTARNH